MRRAIVSAMLCLIAIPILSACGQKGPLALPASDTKAPDHAEDKKK
jgi:predicted small lipoprotein YifL